MCVTDGWPTIHEMNTFVLEADRLEGPWRLLTFMEHFGAQAYFVNVPSKFVSADGRTAWLCYSANFTNAHPEHFPGNPLVDVNPPESRYAMCLHEFELL